MRVWCVRAAPAAAAGVCGGRVLSVLEFALSHGQRTSQLALVLRFRFTNTDIVYLAFPTWRLINWRPLIRPPC